MTETLTFDLTSVVKANSGQQIPLGVLYAISGIAGAVFIALAAMLVLRAAPTFQHLFFLSASIAWMALSVWGAYFVLAPLPDAIAVSDQGWKALVRGRVAREGKWHDPQLRFSLIDWRDSPSAVERLKTEPSVLLRLIFFSGTGRARLNERRFNLTPEAFSTLVEMAKSQGVTMTPRRRSTGPQSVYVETYFGVAPEK